MEEEKSRRVRRVNLSKCDKLKKWQLRVKILKFSKQLTELKMSLGDKGKDLLTIEDNLMRLRGLLHSKVFAL
jgi:hypothetical protein